METMHALGIALAFAMFQARIPQGNLQEARHEDCADSNFSS